MKIAIEAQRIFRVNKHGMDFVALEVIRELQKIDRENEYFILVNAGEDRCLEESENMHIVTVNAPLYPLWEQVCLPEAVRRIGPDILHCTGNTAPLRCDVPLVLTLHDIIFLEKRSGSSPSWYQNMGWYYRRFVVPRVLPKCRRIITVSNYERERIGSALQIGGDRLVAVYNGYGSHFRPVESPYEVTRKYLPEKEYLFFLGNTDPKKNTARTLRAYALYARQTERPLPLLVADIPENVIDGILKEQHISTSNRCCACPVTFSTAICRRYIAERRFFFIRRCARASESRCWRRWPAERRSLLPTLRRCPRSPGAGPCWSIRRTRRRSPEQCGDCWTIRNCTNASGLTGWSG